MKDRKTITRHVMAVILVVIGIAYLLPGRKILTAVLTLLAASLISPVFSSIVQKKWAAKPKKIIITWIPLLLIALAIITK